MGDQRRGVGASLRLCPRRLHDEQFHGVNPTRSTCSTEARGAGYIVGVVGESTSIWFGHMSHALSVMVSGLDCIVFVEFIAAIDSTESRSIATAVCLMLCRSPIQWADFRLPFPCSL